MISGLPETWIMPSSSSAALISTVVKDLTHILSLPTCEAGVHPLIDDGKHEARSATWVKVSAHRQYCSVHSNQLIKHINKISILRNLFTFTLSHTVEVQQLVTLFNMDLKT